MHYRELLDYLDKLPHALEVCRESKTGHIPIAVGKTILCPINWTGWCPRWLQENMVLVFNRINPGQIFFFRREDAVQLKAELVLAALSKNV